MTRWNHKKYIITFRDGETKEIELTNRQLVQNQKIAVRIGANIKEQAG